MNLQKQFRAVLKIRPEGSDPPWTPIRSLQARPATTRNAFRPVLNRQSMQPRCYQIW